MSSLSIHTKKRRNVGPLPRATSSFPPPCPQSQMGKVLDCGNGGQWRSQVGSEQEKEEKFDSHVHWTQKSTVVFGKKKKMLLILQNLLFGLPHGPFLAPPLMVARHSTQDECRFGSIVHTVRSSFSLEQLCRLRSDSAFREFQFSDNEGAYDSAQTKCLQLTRPVSSNVILSPSSCQSLDRLQFIIL